MNDNILVALVFVILSLITLIIYFIFEYKRHLNQKDAQIKKLSQKIDDFEKRLKEKDRRNSFRLEADIEKCKFQILKIGDKEIDLIKGRIGLGIIRDVSFTGLRLESEFDLPVKDVVEVKLEFEFENHELELKGLLLRKEEHINNKNFIYGIKLIETDARMQNHFNKIIRNKELENRRNLISGIN